MFPKSNPADAPRPLPLQNIRSPSAANEGPGLQYPGNRASAAGYDAEKVQANALQAKAAAMIEAGYGRNDDERAVLAAMFRIAKALSLAREDCCMGRSRDGLTG